MPYLASLSQVMYSAPATAKRAAPIDKNVKVIDPAPLVVAAANNKACM